MHIFQAIEFNMQNATFEKGYRNGYGYFELESYISLTTANMIDSMAVWVFSPVFSIPTLAI